MSTSRKPFDTQPLEPPVFGEETEISARRVVPLSTDQIKRGGRGQFNLTTWAALLVVVIAIGAGLVAGLVIGAYGDHNAVAPETQAEQAAPPAPEPSTSASVEPAAAELAHSGDMTADSEFGDSSTSKAERPVSNPHKDRVSEKPAKKTEIKESAEPENKVERPRRTKPVEDESPAVQKNGKRSDAQSTNDNDERRRERDVRQAERPRRVTDSDVNRIQDIFMGPRPRP